MHPTLNAQQGSNLSPDDIAAIHNNGMSYCYDSLLHLKQLNYPNDSLLLYNYKYATRYLSNALSISEDTIILALNSWGITESNYLNGTAFSCFGNDSSTAASINSLPNQVLRYYFTQLLIIVDTSNYYEDFENSCLALLSIAHASYEQNNELSYDEYTQFDAVCKIAVASCQYWKDYYNNWSNQFGEIPPVIKSKNEIQAKQTFHPTVKRVLKRDIEGAGSGAIWGLIGGGAATLGVGAGAAALFGACCGATYLSAWEGLCAAIGW